MNPSSINQIQNHPKLLMQFNNKTQQPPKLVSINQYTTQNQSINQTNQTHTTIHNPHINNTNFYNTRDNNNSINQQKQDNIQQQSYMSTFNNPLNKINAPSYYTTLRKQLPITEPRNYRIQVINLEKQLQIEKEEKFQLQQIIKELTINTQKLKQVNEHLVQRLKQIQKSFIQQKITQQKQQQDKIKKSINKTYQEVEQFIRHQIQSIANKLKGQKMTPLLQRKLQLFMESMLQINQNTVEMFKLSKKNNNSANKANTLLNSRMNYASDKQNLIKLNQSNIIYRTNQDTTHNHSLNLFTTNKKNQGRSSKKRQQFSSDSKRLINNSYISSYKNNLQNESHIVLDSGNKQKTSSHPQNSILKHLQNRSYYNNYDTTNLNQNTYQQGDQLFENIAFVDKNRQNQNNSLLNDAQLKRRNKLLEQSYKDRKKYYQTSSYDQNNFKIKQYTPNKRKRIFGEDRNHSRVKNYSTIQPED